jgi:hypothetical protein
MNDERAQLAVADHKKDVKRMCYGLDMDGYGWILGGIELVVGSVKGNEMIIASSIDLLGQRTRNRC